jgi:hypothetical protein
MKYGSGMISGPVLHVKSHKMYLKKTKKISVGPSASEAYRPSDRRFSANLVPTSVDRGCHVVSATDSYGRILDFLDRSHYFFFQVAPIVLTKLSGTPFSQNLLSLCEQGSTQLNLLSFEN